MAKDFRILNIQRNSGCDLCPCPFPIFPLPPSQFRIPAWPESGEKLSLSYSKSNLSGSDYRWIFRIRQTQIFTWFWSGGDSKLRWRKRENGKWTWITTGIPLYIQNSETFSHLRRKNSVNGYICQFLNWHWQYSNKNYI